MKKRQWIIGILLVVLLIAGKDSGLAGGATVFVCGVDCFAVAAILAGFLAMKLQRSRLRSVLLVLISASKKTGICANQRLTGTRLPKYILRASDFRACQGASKSF